MLNPTFDRTAIATIVMNALDGGHGSPSCDDFRVADAFIAYLSTPRPPAAAQGAATPEADVAAFLAGHTVRDPEATLATSALFEAYQLWAARHDRTRLRQLHFSRIVAQEQAVRRLASGYVFTGIRFAGAHAVGEAA